MNFNEISVRAHILASRAANRIVTLAQERRDTLEQNRRVQDALAAGEDLPSDHYAGGRAIERWYRYKQDFGGRNEITTRNRFMAAALRTIDYTSLVNFGCLYGFIESDSHRAGHAAFGVDRDPELKRLNEAEFPGPTFVASDIFDFLRSRRFDGGAFTHINIGTYFLPPFLSRLYRLVAAQGFRHILIWEPSPVSWITGRYYRYSDQPQKTVLARGPMVLNNYPQLLSAAGFGVRAIEIKRTPHPSLDFRSVYIHAERPGKK